MPDSEFIAHIPCESCGSSDANALYSDGHQHCFSCGHRRNGGATEGRAQQQTPRKPMHDFITGHARALAKRGLTEETCAKWGYTVGSYSDGRAVQLANYRRDGAIVAQKVRFPDKSFRFLGDTKNCGLFGQHLWSPGRRVIVTEGEIDALSVSQAQNNRWPVVSLPNGAQGARKSLAKELEWLEQFEEVVLMFDMDEPGQQAARACVDLFSPGKCKVAHLPTKDPNELLVAGKGADIVSAGWNAKAYRPDGVVTLGDIREKVLQELPTGLPWFMPSLTKWTHGRRLGEVYGFGAGTGVGKTDLFTQEIAHTAVTLGEKVAVVYLEQPPAETARRVAGKFKKRRFHVPDAGWTQEELVSAIDELEQSGNLWLYDSFGSTEWGVIRSRLKYLVHAEGVRHIFLDHLTALAAAEDDEKKALEHIMADIASFAQEHQVCFYFVSHLATPEGKPHEEGGRVMIRHFKGSRAIGFWSHALFGLERNQQAEDEQERQTTTFRVLKDRMTGQSTGKTLRLGYDIELGLLYETTPPEDNPFASEEADGGSDF